mmetsp:Transcript_57364/g.136354  ORF Transcript_57364/g.136354 Transcript_57364/m.136354 type:complete len:100 (+) Transcript_57364:159-458(+)|eukprot:CAMPEP_0178432756 /NCGR_PEP_ID=MMETSP0689_2-20121128/32555_1 /TAXON_ID=160604 /ORGANISM="Amphidinium massartii, Strain CS-259" /LENGTH=99 /DNA_ID=CAMNT_0020054765 /DNA_START=81 /DNA_END=380 /DNA_ORIENTATION=+
MEAMKMQERSAAGKPPVGWSAASSGSRSLNKELSVVADRAGEGTAGGKSGNTGPGLPFRIKDAYVYPCRTGKDAVYTMSMPLYPPGSDKEVSHMMAYIG